MPRMPYPDPSQFSPVKQAYVEEMGERMLNVVRMGMHTPDALWEKQRDLSAGSVRLPTLDPVDREVLVLVVGFVSKSDYVLYHHVSISRNLGMSDDLIAAIERGDYGKLDERHAAIAQFTAEVVRDVTPGDATLAALRAHFSDAHVMEMVTLIGNYMMTARMAGVSGCELDGKAIAGWAWDRKRGS